MRPEQTLDLTALTLCAEAEPVVFNALAQALRPPPRLKVSEWAEKHRIVSAESGSRYPGEWRNHRAPHLIDIMDALGPDDPAEDVVVVASAQVGKSEVGINFTGFVVAQDPGPMIIVLPSHDESIKYVRTKLQPAIDESPALRSRVLDMTSKSERGSTASYKRFRGGFAQITFAGSSKGLQMLSAKYTVGDEVSEWPAVAGERGDPVAQLKVRTKIYERDRKRLWVSTPAILGTCRITNDYERSDKRRRYVPCPHCGEYQILKFDRLKWDSDTWPHKAFFQCASSGGCVIDHLDKEAMVQAGVWIATAGEDGPGDSFPAEELDHWKSRVVPGRIRGFHIWQAYTLFSTWNSIVAEWLEAKGGHERQRVFTQQVLGEAWEDRGDAPDAERLHASRVPSFLKGQPPEGPVIFTGATDVQGNRLEWAVYGWSEGMTRWLVDWGVIEGDPNDVGTWAAHDRMMQERRYCPGGCDPLEVDAWAVDSGYASHAVYNYVRGRPRLFAVDGRDGRAEPFIGAPKKREVRWNGKTIPNGVMLWPVGSFALKSDLYSAIRRTIAGPDKETGQWSAGSIILPGDMGLGYAEQLTSEHLMAVEAKSGVVTYRWDKLTGRPNEGLDIACYARAMAYHLRLDRLTADMWKALRLERCVVTQPEAQPDLFSVSVAAPAELPQASPKPAAPMVRRSRGKIS
ncbi:phage terminase large subunit family protein [Cereibacter sp. SYSU M97828]|nr:phage terminase large subunit family protein [Cereibacter flavus]